MIHRDIELRGEGFDPVAPITQHVPEIGAIQRLAHERKIDVSELVTFQIGTDMWCVYKRGSA